MKEAVIALFIGIYVVTILLTIVVNLIKWIETEYSMETFYFSIIILIICTISIYQMTDKEIESDKIIHPDIIIETIDGVSDTTRIYYKR